MSNVHFFCLFRGSRKAWWRHALHNQNIWAWISSTYLWLFQNFNIPVGTRLTFELMVYIFPKKNVLQFYKIDGVDQLPLPLSRKNTRIPAWDPDHGSLKVLARAGQNTWNCATVGACNWNMDQHWVTFKTIQLQESHCTVNHDRKDPIEYRINFLKMRQGGHASDSQPFLNAFPLPHLKFHKGSRSSYYFVKIISDALQKFIGFFSHHVSLKASGHLPNPPTIQPCRAASEWCPKAS